MPDGTPFLVVAASGRALAASARKAGYRVAVLDQFGDCDLAALATASRKVRLNKAGGFAAASLLAAAERLAPAGASPPWGLVYGSGLEADPGLLRRLAAGRRLFGNPPETLARAKDPEVFAALLAELGLPHPEIRRKAPPLDEAAAWLVKTVGGTGGGHIRPAAQVLRQPRRGGNAAATCHPPAHYPPAHYPSAYFQRRVEGRAVSALVLADGRRARVLGFTAQWASPALPDQPLRYGGAAAPAILSRQNIAGAACKLTEALGLVGLNSIDFIVAGEGRSDYYVIEANPRPGATVNLFERADPADHTGRPDHADHANRAGRGLFDLHLRAASGALPRLPRKPWFPAGTGFADAILYAGEGFAMPHDFPWPVWAVDRPQAGAAIAAGAPICTVMAEAGGKGGDGASTGTLAPAGRARSLALRRSRALRARIGRYIQSSSV